MKRVVDRPPQTDLELYWAIKAVWGLTIPWTGVCKEHSTPFEAFADAYFARSSVAVWWASRGFGGKSYLLSCLGLTEAAFLGARATILGGSGAQSLNVHEHSKNLWYAPNAPSNLLKGEPTKYDTYLTNDGHIRSLMASQTSVRGPHPQRLRMDEIDEMELSILEAAQGQPMRKKNPDGTVKIETHTVMSSTWQYPEGTMTTILDRAREKGWALHNWCWRETSNPHDGWLEEDEVERKRGEIPQAMWEAEYDLQEPNPENRIFSQEIIELMFPVNDGIFEGEGPHVFAEKERGIWYTTGVDWAKEKDRTVIVTFADDGEQMRAVEWRSIQKVSWTAVAQAAAAQWLRWGGQFTHDNTGVGDVVDDVLRDIVPRPWLRRIRPITMNGQARSNLFTEYISAVEDHKIVCPRVELAYNEHRFVTMDDLYGRGHPPDTIVAHAMAWQGKARRKAVALALPRGDTRVSPNIV